MTSFTLTSAAHPIIKAASIVRIFRECADRFVLEALGRFPVSLGRSGSVLQVAFSDRPFPGLFLHPRDLRTGDVISLRPLENMASRRFDPEENHARTGICGALALLPE